MLSSAILRGSDLGTLLECVGSTRCRATEEEHRFGCLVGLGATCVHDSVLNGEGRGGKMEGWESGR